jgi:nicotinamidase-related amidase
VAVMKPALIVVDVQNGFVTKDSIHVISVVTNLVSHWQAAGGQTIFTLYHNYPDSPFERLVEWYCLKEPPETDLVSELEPYMSHPQAHVIEKTVYTAFTDEGRQLFSRLGLTDLFICGIATDGCVLKTTLDAFEAGYTPWLLADASASNSTRVSAQEVHQGALLLARRLVGRGQVIQSSKALAMALPTVPGSASGAIR